MIPRQILLVALLGWLEGEQRDVIAFLREENRTLKAQLGSRRLRLKDDQRRRLALLGHRLGRRVLRAHWPALVAADFFTTEVWTAQGLVTYITLFVIELQSRRVHVVGSTRHPNEAFVVQAIRHLTNGIDEVLARGCVLICDRDRKWSHAVLAFLDQEEVRVVQTPFRAPNCNAYAERFVRSTKEECLNRVILLGERHLRRTIADFVAHYHGERNHQGIDNELIQPLGQADARGTFADASAWEAC